MLRIAIQAKGRLNEQSLGLLLEAGIAVAEGKRRLIARAEGFPLEVLFLRDDDIPQAVSMGVADLGIVGQNEVAEKGYDVEQAMPLGFGACRLSLAVPNAADYTGPDYFRGRRVATSYPNILRGYFARQGIEAEIYTIEGSVEIAPAVGLSDAIFDIVSSGGTLVSKRPARSGNRSPLRSGAHRLPVARRRQTQPDRAARLPLPIDPRKPRHEIRADEPSRRKGRRSHRPAPRNAQPDDPAAGAGGWCSLHAVIGKAQLWERIERLKAIGAEGILVLALENMIR